VLSARAKKAAISFHESSRLLVSGSGPAPIKGNDPFWPEVTLLDPCSED
jgi:hypothetical protein